ncbi:AraC family transcriptional regulator [Radicibacter daui]|uniref:AraC family transcriptional regulator n=1 Tax=Radicibacter daui TaxID=3064829 RepID=UPI004046FCED
MSLSSPVSPASPAAPVPAATPTQVDALSALAPLLRVSPVLETLCLFSGTWAADHPRVGGGWAAFHLLVRGSCRVDLPETGTSLSLKAGDLLLLPHGASHRVHATSLPPEAAAAPYAPGAPGSAVFGIHTRPTGAALLKTNLPREEGAAEASEVELICGRLTFAAASTRPGENLVLATLPDSLVVSTGGEGAAEVGTGQAALMREAMRHIGRELAAGSPGAASITADLASALFVMAVREHLLKAEAGSAHRSVLLLLADRQAGRAVSAMLADPARDWSLDDLAAEALTSRASLVRLFRRLAGLAPLECLAALRLDIARQRLAAVGPRLASLGDIAAEVGYQSESAFSRAFQRRFGLRPGEARRA